MMNISSILFDRKSNVLCKMNMESLFPQEEHGSRIEDVFPDITTPFFECVIEEKERCKLHIILNGRHYLIQTVELEDEVGGRIGVQLFLIPYTYIEKY